jgi:hypothetical protein
MIPFEGASPHRFRADHSPERKSPHCSDDFSVDFPFREWERISTAIHIDQPVRKYCFAITLSVPKVYELSTT